MEKELRTIRRAHKESNPDFHTFAEGCHERFSSLYDVNQGHGEEYSWQIGKSMPEQFLYTFPDRIVTGHCADKQQMYHAMAQLKPLDIKSSCFEDRSNWEPIQTYIALRKQYKAYFLQGTFIDDEGFSYQQGVRVFAVRAEDQSLCFCVWVQGAVEETACWASVRLPKEYTPHKAIYPSQVSMEKDGAWIKLAWTGPLCYILAGK